jgi:hypothetical protein
VLVELRGVFETLQTAKLREPVSGLELDLAEVTGGPRNLEQSLDGAHRRRIPSLQTPFPRADG